MRDYTTPVAGPSAFQEAKHRSKQGHKTWLYWVDTRSNMGHADRVTAASIQAARRYGRSWHIMDAGTSLVADLAMLRNMEFRLEEGFTI